MTGPHRSWSVLAPFPAALQLGELSHSPLGTLGPVDVDRNRLLQLIGDHDWPAIGWPELLDRLVSLGRTDIPFARLAEGHIDALRIIRQAGRQPVADALYGVWASRSRGGGLSATPGADIVQLSGSIPFASGAGLLDRALVTAAVPPAAAGGSAEQVSVQLLLDVDVGDWAPDLDSWPAAAMTASRSFTVRLDNRSVPANCQVGPAGFYLDRPQFFPGGIGVAAVWVGAAARVADLLCRFTDSSPHPPDQVTRTHWGRVRIELAGTHAQLRHGGQLLAAGVESEWDSPTLQQLATEVRSGVGAAVRRVLELARTVAGPAGLAHDGALGAAIADLDLYVRQQPSDRDAEFLADHG